MAWLKSSICPCIVCGFIGGAVAAVVLTGPLTCLTLLAPALPPFSSSKITPAHAARIMRLLTIILLTRCKPMLCSIEVSRREQVYIPVRVLIHRVTPQLNQALSAHLPDHHTSLLELRNQCIPRSEERRVGKECRYRW